MNACRCLAVAFFSLSLGFAGSVLAQDHRELGPHVHGTGTLNIAIEAKQVSMDFSAPAADILGFEHQPTTPEQEKTLADAKASLSEPLSIFALPAAAGCSKISANVAFNAEQGQPGSSADHQHADFDVDYVLTCEAPQKLTQIDFPYFKRFFRAQKLNVTVVSEAGQSQFEISGTSPSHPLR
jgi:uncharacterized protein DUF2796